MKHKIMKNWISIVITMFFCIVVIGLCSIPFIWNDWFFETHTTIAEKLKYAGAFIGGILFVVNAYFLYKRTKELNKSNNLTAKGQELIAKGQLDTRFKDAATLLAAGNTSAELSGIHALHQIAVEASKTEYQKDYVKVIKDILIAFIRDNSVLKESKDENGNLMGPHNKKSEIVLQTIIDKLFKDNNCKIYADYPTDLSETVLKEINFCNAQLQGAGFVQAQLQGAVFFKAQLQGAYFFMAELQGASFGNAQLQDAYFEDAYNIDKATFKNTSWNEKTNFKGTAFENKTIEELTEIMGNPPTPLE